MTYEQILRTALQLIRSGGLTGERLATITDGDLPTLTLIAEGEGFDALEVIPNDGAALVAAAREGIQFVLDQRRRW